MSQYYIDKDIRKASTLPTSFYLDQDIFEQSKEAIFAKSWQFAADVHELEREGTAFPFELLPHLLPEPLVMVRDKQGTLRCLSNVCTHRGNIIVTQAGKMRMLSCGYHGRCFNLDGKFRAMPEFETVEDFPSKEDHLKTLPHAQWGPLLFASLAARHPFDLTRKALDKRLYFLPLEGLRFSPEDSKDYPIEAHWALYCDNFLEGFHIPFVHPALHAALEKDAYEYHLFETGNLQVGIAKEGEPCFDLPKDHPDFGKNIYAFYYWLFPNIMLNVYPWGLSMNMVIPLSPNSSIVRYRTYYFEGINFDREVNRIDETEFEDQTVVESVQRGLRSRNYTKGRFSPTMEQGVHQFHCLLADAFEQIA